MKEVVEVLNASVGFVYGARNGTADDKGARFAAALDALDSVLASSGGPFVRGSGSRRPIWPWLRRSSASASSSRC